MRQIRKLDRLSLFIFFLCFVVPILIFYNYNNFFIDDAYITFRYVENFYSFGELSFNKGDFVEGYSNFLFLILLIPFKYLGFELITTAKAISYLSYLGIGIVVFSYLKDLHKEPYSKMASLLGIVFCYLSIPIFTWAISGMETTLFTLFITIGIVGTLRILDEEKLPNNYVLFIGIIFGLSCLTRPEGPLFVFVSAAFIFLKHVLTENKKYLISFLILSLSSGIIFSTFILWRYSYYGEFLPNTYYAKISGLEGPLIWEKGFYYLKLFLKAPPFLGTVFLCYTIYSIYRKFMKISDIYLCLLTFSFTAYIIYSGGDWMDNSRLIVPIIPAIILFLCRLFTKSFISKNIPKKKKEKFANIFVICVTLICCSQVVFIKLIGNSSLTREYWSEIAKHINNEWEVGSRIGINMAGYIPYKTLNHEYLDMHGLNDRHIARHKVSKDFLVEKNITEIGHLKGDGKYIMEQKPDYIIFGGAVGIVNSRAVYVAEYELLTDDNFINNYKLEYRTLDMNSSVLPAIKDFDFYYYKRIN